MQWASSMTSSALSCPYQRSNCDFNIYCRYCDIVGKLAMHCVYCNHSYKSKLETRTHTQSSRSQIQLTTHGTTTTTKTYKAPRSPVQRLQRAPDPPTNRQNKIQKETPQDFMPQGHLTEMLMHRVSRRNESLPRAKQIQNQNPNYKQTAKVPRAARTS